MDSMDYKAMTRRGPGLFCSAHQWTAAVLGGMSEEDLKALKDGAVAAGLCKTRTANKVIAQACIATLMWRRRLLNEKIMQQEEEGRKAMEKVWEKILDDLGFSPEVCRYVRDELEKKHESLIEEAIEKQQSYDGSSAWMCRIRDRVGNSHSFISCAGNNKGVVWAVDRGGAAKYFGRVISARLAGGEFANDSEGSSMDTDDLSSIEVDSSKEEECNFDGFPDSRLDKRTSYFVEIWTETWGYIDGARVYVTRESIPEIRDLLSERLKSDSCILQKLEGKEKTKEQREKEQEKDKEALEEEAKFYREPEKHITFEKKISKDEISENLQWLSDCLDGEGGILHKSKFSEEPYNKIDIPRHVAQQGDNHFLNYVHLVREQRRKEEAARLSQKPKKKSAGDAFRQRKAPPKRAVVRKVVMTPKGMDGAIVQFRVIGNTVVEEEDGVRHQVSSIEFKDDHHQLIVRYTKGSCRVHNFEVDMVTSKDVATWVLSLAELCRSFSKFVSCKMPWRLKRSMFFQRNGDLSMREEWDFDEPPPTPLTPSPSFLPLPRLKSPLQQPCRPRVSSRPRSASSSPMASSSPSSMSCSPRSSASRATPAWRSA